MKASIVDLRYKTAEVLKALERNETVTVLYHGKVKGVIKPFSEGSTSSASKHPFFGMHRDATTSVRDDLEQLRKARHDI